MILLGQTLNIVIVIGIAAGHWALPSRLGLLGVFCAQCATVFGWFVMGAIALATGVWAEYDGILNHIGLLIQAIIANVVMLPLNGFALRRFRRRRQGSSWLDIPATHS